jgi:hypothetical protein
MGDMNGRVGKRRSPWEKYLGPYSYCTTPCNENGLHTLELCSEHNLFIAELSSTIKPLKLKQNMHGTVQILGTHPKLITYLLINNRENK